MADNKEPADMSKLSLADRMTKDGKKFDWADDEEDQPALTSDVTKAQTDGAADTEKASVENAQKDGANAFVGGSGLEEPLGEAYDVNVTLADLQQDPNNPLFSAKSFDDLNLPPKLREGIKVSNYHSPSRIQERALPLLLLNPPKNLIGQSQSGTGKTAAFNINMLVRVDLSTKQPQCLVLAPTRELAKQIATSASVLGAMMEEDGLKVTEAVPSSNKEARGKQVEGQIIVGTPGTVIELIKRRYLDTRGIKVLTLDEADNMLDLQGMGDQCKRVKQQIPKSAQIVLFSATFPDAVQDFANSFAPNANKITLQVDQLTVKGIKQMYLDCDTDEAKYAALLKFYSLMTISSSIIFVKRRDTATEIERRMTADGHKVAALSGALDGDARDHVFERFRTGAAKVLITTNVLARGIDVQTVTMVINYDVPDLPGGQPDYETYLHRIGRTGRFGRTGAALTFVHNRKSWGQLMDICNHFGVEPTKLDTSDWDKVEKMLKAIMKNSRNVIGKEVTMGD